MAKRRSKKAKRNTHRRVSSAGTRKSRRRNPFTRSTRRRRRNTGGIAGKTSNILLMGFWVVVGLALTRQIPQLLLGAKNTGVMGYLANIATAIASAMVASNVGGERAAMGAGAGGGAYVITRVLQEHMSPIGKYLSMQGLGDPLAMGEILTGDRTYFPMPLAYDNNRAPIIPSQIRAVPSVALPPPTAMGNYRRRAAM